MVCFIIMYRVVWNLNFKLVCKQFCCVILLNPISNPSCINSRYLLTQIRGNVDTNPEFKSRYRDDFSVHYCKGFWSSLILLFVTLRTFIVKLLFGQIMFIVLSMEENQKDFIPNLFENKTQKGPRCGREALFQIFRIF